jgi:predicted dehydrogenase
MITFKNGVTANLMTGCFVTGEGNPIRNGITVVGREKSIDYLLRESVTVYTAKQQLTYRQAMDQSILHDRAFLDAVRAKDPGAVRSPYADAYKSLLLADAANRSMAAGSPVKL